MHAHKLKVTIPEDHRVEVRLPNDFPEGPAEVIVLTNRSAVDAQPSPQQRTLAALAELRSMQLTPEEEEVLDGFETLPDRRRNEQLLQSLSHPHPESLEMTEVGFAIWAEGLSDDASDLIAPGAGEEVRWTADCGWVGTDE